jgi:GH24 family phage-related lysozyme (muramidase)
MKILILSATPMFDRPSEIGLTLNLLKPKKEFPIGTQTDTIINEIYPDIQVEDKKDIIIEFLKEYNQNLTFEESGLQLKQTELFPHTERAQVAYPDLKEIMAKFARRIGNDYFVDEIGTVGEMDFSDIAISGLKSDEGFEDTPYNDNKSLNWERDKDRVKTGWTIGYGHKITEDEFKTGIIKLKNGRKINWKKKLKKEDAERIKADDIINHAIDNAGLDSNAKIPRSLYDALTRLSFNFGHRNLVRFISNIKDESGNLSSDLFAKEISGWTKVQDKENVKGIIIDRMGSLLAARGILLPENPNHINLKEDTISIIINRYISSEDFRDNL